MSGGSESTGGNSVFSNIKINVPKYLKINCSTSKDFFWGGRGGGGR